MDQFTQLSLCIPLMWDPSIPIVLLEMPQSYYYPLPVNLNAQNLRPCMNCPCLNCFMRIPQLTPPPEPQWQRTILMRESIQVNDMEPREMMMTRTNVTRNSGKALGVSASGIPLTDDNHCVLCRSNREREEFYMAHTLRDKGDKVTCPVLRTFICEVCGATGDAAHTRKYCPWNTRVPIRLRSKNHDKAKRAVLKVLGSPSSKETEGNDTTTGTENELKKTDNNNDNHHNVAKTNETLASIPSSSTVEVKKKEKEKVEVKKILEETEEPSRPLTPPTPSTPTTPEDNETTPKKTEEPGNSGDPTNKFVCYKLVRNAAGQFRRLKY